MELNPEFRRNLWQEITVHRLVATPLFLGAVMFLVYLASNNDTTALNGASFMFFVVFTMLWGAKMTSTSVISEVQGLTWDSQRTSSLGPWTLTWGKLLGSNAFTWYVAFFMLLIYLATINTPAFQSPYSMIILAVLGALLAQAVGMLSSLGMVLRKDVSSRAGYGSLGGGIIVAAVILLLGMIPSRGLWANKTTYLHWYSMKFDIMDVFIYTTAICLFWTVYGIYVIMRTELQVMTTFLPWLAFVVFAMFYTAGFSADIAPGGTSAYQTAVTISFFIVMCLTFIMLFIQKKDPVRFRAALRAAGERNWQTLRCLLPNWAATIPVCALLAILAQTAFDNDDKYVFFTIFLFFMRDAAIVLFLNLGRSVRMADVTAVIYLAVFYAVIPGILYALKMQGFNFLFYPGVHAAGLAASAAQAALVLVLLKRRWDKNHRTLLGPIQQDV